jgi:starch-binding outer membrane protein SusE/F
MNQLRYYTLFGLLLSLLAWGCGDDDINPHIEGLLHETNEVVTVSAATPYVPVAFRASATDLQRVTVEITPMGSTDVVASAALNNIISNTLNRVSLQVPFPSVQDAPSGMYTVHYRLFSKSGEHSATYDINVVNELGVVVALPTLWVPGAHQGWSPDTAPNVYSTEDNGIYTGYVFMSAGNEFKFTSAPNWNGTNYGNGGSGILSSDGGAGNLTVTEDGYYYLTANIPDLTWSAEVHSWGVVGDGAAGWDNDQVLTYDAESQTLRTTIPLTGGNKIKFRLNGGWDTNLGDDGADGTLEFNGADIIVAESGTYEIILDLRNPANYTYTLIKQ